MEEKNAYQWSTIERPGYFAKKRDELADKWNKEYGSENWRLAWQLGSQVIEKKEALQVYEDSYYEFLKNNKDVMEWLTDNFSDVYDNALTNVMSGFNYDIQETPNTHLQDISVRRSVLRLGKCFKGDKLLEVRSRDAEGWKLSPCNIPFHLPDLILPGEIKDYSGKNGWWDRLGIPNSLEKWYQQNKLLQIKK